MTSNSQHFKLLIVLGEGGHTQQMLNLVDLLGDAHEYHYVISREDNLSANQIRRPGPIYRVTRPRGKRTGAISAAFRTILTAVQSLGILLRVQPAAVVSAGPAIGVSISMMGKLLGADIIFIESSSRIKRLSLSGRIMYRWADLFFVQWPYLKQEWPQAVYAGRLV
jgi:UDP-N-acetylglucosamine:LPS N-acetylglucosamine transferase